MNNNDQQSQKNEADKILMRVGYGFTIGLSKIIIVEPKQNYSTK